MNADSLDRTLLESNWQANEGELNRIRTMPGLDREMHAADYVPSWSSARADCFTGAVCS